MDIFCAIKNINYKSRAKQVIEYVQNILLQFYSLNMPYNLFLYIGVNALQ